VTEEPKSQSYDVVVVGGGAIGLACAWRLARRGLSVLVAERDRPGAGASGAAAGMLAPVTEAEFGEEALLRANLASAAAWPAFAAELSEFTGLATGYRESGALVVAADRDDAEELRRLHAFQQRLGLGAEWLSPSAARRLEPGLSPRIAGAIHAPQDHQVDPAALIAGLADAAVRAGAEIARLDVTGVEPDAVHARERRVAAGRVVVAAGCWSGALVELPVRPVKGQVLHCNTRGVDRLCERLVRTPRCYVVDRGDGRVVIGATVEERGFDTEITAAGVFRLLEAALEVLPDVEELAFEGATAGLRPGTPDNLPLVGLAEDGVVLATGHYRNGVLLAPLTADAVAAAVLGDDPPEEAAALSPARLGVTVR
jgi:glycine oxidase